MQLFFKYQGGIGLHANVCWTVYPPPDKLPPIFEKFSKVNHINNWVFISYKLIVDQCKRDLSFFPHQMTKGFILTFCNRMIMENHLSNWIAEEHRLFFFQQIGFVQFSGKQSNQNWSWNQQIKKSSYFWPATFQSLWNLGVYKRKYSSAMFVRTSAADV